MRLELRNVGLLREADIDLRDFTITMGLNNTGKSTLATALYCAIRAARRDEVSRSVRMSQHAATPRRVRDDLVRRMVQNPRRTKDDPAGLNVVLKDLYENVLHQYGRAFIRELESALGAPIADLATRAERRYPLRITIRNYRPDWEIRISLRGKNVTIKPLVDPAQVSLDLTRRFTFDHLDKMPTLEYAAIARYIIDEAWAAGFAALFSGFPRNAHYLPAARAGLLQSHRLVAAALLQNTSRVGFGELSMPALSGVVADFLSEILLITPSTRRRRVTALTTAANQIEHRVLRGKVRHRLDQSSSYPEIEFQDQVGGTFALHRTSSMISELAPIVLLLRQVLDEGDLLIIEEPESHLHPAAQAELSAILYALSKQNVPIFVTTHSDFVLTATNNCMRAEMIADSFKSDSVRAYWIEVRTDGSHLMALEIDPLDGIAEQSFADVAEQLYDAQVDQQLSIVASSE
jgi:predicted ATPase